VSKFEVSEMLAGNVPRLGAGLDVLTSSPGTAAQ
jgi:hypothetical protein